MTNPFGCSVRRKEIAMYDSFDEDMILGFEMPEEELNYYVSLPQRTQEEEDRLIREMEREHEGNKTF